MPIDKQLFETLADIAARESLPLFRRAVVIENKDAAGFDPVTLADRKTEQALRRYLSRAFPDHGILGEEEGLTSGEREYVWVIDPIDGTRSFISGIPLWGTLVGLTCNGTAVAGMMAQPYMQEMFYSCGAGSFLERRGKAPQKLATSGKTGLDEATLFTTDPALFDAGSAPAFERLRAAVRLTRYSADCYAFAMLSCGQADLVVETGLQPYDIMALIPIIRQAGGIISQWNGGAAEKGGNIIAAASEQLYEAALEYLVKR